MKTHLLKYMILIATLSALFSCKKTPYLSFKDTHRIQFGPNDYGNIYQENAWSKDQSVSYSFAFDAVQKTQDTVFFNVYATGGITDYDRRISLLQEQVPDALNAVAGQHYVAFDDPKVSDYYVIKANTIYTKIPIIILNDASLNTSKQILKINLVANDNFQLGESIYLWRQVGFTNLLSRPSAWIDYYFGKYSTVKHRFFIETTKEKWDNDFINTMLTNIPLRDYYISSLKAAIIEYNKAHPNDPLKDETGEPVTM